MIYKLILDGTVCRHNGKKVSASYSWPEGKPFSFVEDKLAKFTRAFCDVKFTYSTVSPDSPIGRDNSFKS